MQTAAAANSATASDSEKPTNKQLMPELEAYIDTIREKYAAVFSKPSGLPPDRGIQHASNLVENAFHPFNVCTGYLLMKSGKLYSTSLISS